MMIRVGPNGQLLRLSLLFSLAVNAYVLIFIIYHQDLFLQRSETRSKEGGWTRETRTLSSAWQASAAGPLYGSSLAWPTLTGAAPEVWAAGTLGANMSLASAVASTLNSRERDELLALCGRCLHQTITRSVEVHDIGESAFVATGDIPDEWIRDGAVQTALYLPRVAQHPVLRPIIEGVIRKQAYFILSDPWANSYRQKWAHPKTLPKMDRQIGRGGWVATRNFEVDSGAYWLNLLWNYASTPGAFWAAADFLNSSIIHDAAALLIDVWTLEQRHEELSPYRYAELARDGKGPPCNYTGMIWSGFRPSDDPNVYSFNIPVNMYAAGALERLVELNQRVWRDGALEAAAARLASEIRTGIETYGVVQVSAVNTNASTTSDPGGGAAPVSTIYAYEVNGLGGVLHSFDDPNVPSLLSIPLLGYRHYDPAIYNRTRRQILSPANSHYFEGAKLRGCGSPHTYRNYVWSLGHCVQGLTSSDPQERADLFRQLLSMQGDNGLMHESNEVNNPSMYSRALFQWANTMLVVFYEQTFGQSCTESAELLRLAEIQKREAADTLKPRNGGPDLPAYYERLEQLIPHV